MCSNFSQTYVLRRESGDRGETEAMFLQLLLTLTVMGLWLEVLGGKQCIGHPFGAADCSR